jgi:hypothetical protein
MEPYLFICLFLFLFKHIRIENGALIFSLFIYRFIRALEKMEHNLYLFEKMEIFIYLFIYLFTDLFAHVKNKMGFFLSLFIINSFTFFEGFFVFSICFLFWLSFIIKRGIYLKILLI